MKCPVLCIFPFIFLLSGVGCQTTKVDGLTLQPEYHFPEGTFVVRAQKPVVMSAVVKPEITESIESAVEGEADIKDTAAEEDVVAAVKDPTRVLLMPVMIINISSDNNISTTTASGVGDEASKSYFDMVKSAVGTVFSFMAGAFVSD